MFSNIPNLLTWLRILLIPVFVTVFFLSLLIFLAISVWGHYS